MSKKKTVIHVNQAIIKSNHKKGQREPVLTVKTYDSNSYGHEAVIYDKDGVEVARVIYRPEKPLSCGARVWVECYGKVEVIRYADNGRESKVEETQGTWACVV